MEAQSPPAPEEPVGVGVSTRVTNQGRGFEIRIYSFRELRWEDVLWGLMRLMRKLRATMETMDGELSKTGAEPLLNDKVRDAGGREH